MPRSALKKKSAPTVHNVVEFPRNPNPNNYAFIPKDASEAGIHSFTVEGHQFGQYGIMDGDRVLYDKYFVPKTGDICVLWDEGEEVTIKRYFEFAPSDELIGVVWGFQRQFLRAG